MNLITNIWYTEYWMCDHQNGCNSTHKLRTTKLDGSVLRELVDKLKTRSEFRYQNPGSGKTESTPKNSLT